MQVAITLDRYTLLRTLLKFFELRLRPKVGTLRKDWQGREKR
jgi:hypothetical protein